MSRANKGKGILGEEGITQEAMLAYLQNRLTTEERQQFEKRLQDDPFAAEALEGLQTVDDKNAITATVHHLQEKVKERNGIKTGRSIPLHWSAYAWAAAVLGLLIGIGFLMTNYLVPTNKEMAQATTAERNLPESNKSAEPLLIPDALAEDKEEVKTAEETASTGIVQSQPAETRVLEETPQTIESAKKEDLTGNAGIRTENKAVTTLSTQAPAKNEQQAAPAPRVDDKQAEGDVAVEQITVARKSITLKDSKETVTREKLAAAATTATITLDDAMKSFNAGDYKTASEQFDAVLKQNPDNAEAMYFGGIAEYINGNNNKSEKQFDKLLKTGRYTDGSKWYKANILLKKGKKADAKKLLQEISSTSGQYKERALKKLEELEQ